MRRKEIRAEIKKLEKFKPRNIEEFDFRESEIRRWRNLL